MATQTPVPTPPTLVEALRLAADAGELVSVYDRRAKDTDARSYAELVLRARAWGRWFREQGVQSGDVVFLCLPTSHDLIESLLGASLIGALPCCLALPRAIGGLEVFRRRLTLLADRYPGGQLVTTADVGAELERPFWEVPELDLSALAPLEAVDPQSLAYVQLTSGSTSHPKAVSITHSNLSANTHGIYTAGDGWRANESILSWLPIYHDMGLVGMVFTALFHRMRLTLMRPDTFVGSPLRWLRAIAAEPGTVVTTQPNFGYQWCVDRVPPSKLEGLDLSNLRLAGCGAEMVRPATLDAFCERFADYGFQRSAFAPCYGMAETTLAVSFCTPGKLPRLHEGRVSCGKPIVGLELSIASPQTGETLPDRQEGEIVVRGSSVFPGYFKDEAATAEALREGGFHTGDLGYLHEGELYVTGRLKDLIILDGSNVAPYEIEWIAAQHVDMGSGRAAAFSVERETREVPVLVVEVKGLPEADAIEALRKQVAEDIAPLEDLVFVRRGTLPKTSSGKVKRGRVRELYLSGELESLWRWQEKRDE